MQNLFWILQQAGKFNLNINVDDGIFKNIINK